MAIDLPDPSTGNTYELSFTHIRPMRKIFLLGVLAAGFSFAHPVRASTQFWLSQNHPQVMNVESTVAGKLQYFDLISKKVTAVRSYPNQGPGSMNAIIPPKNGTFVYFRMTGSKSADLVYSRNTVGAPIVVANGQRCYEDYSGSCTKQLVLDDVSDNGRYIAYRKGTVRKLFDTMTGEYTVLPKSLWNTTVHISPDSSYLYGVVLRSGKVSIWTMRIGSTAVVRVSTGLLRYSEVVASTNGKNIAVTAVTGSSENEVASVVIVNPLTKQVVGSGSVPLSMIGLPYVGHNLIWLNQQTFALITNKAQQSENPWGRAVHVGTVGHENLGLTTVYTDSTDHVELVGAVRASNTSLLLEFQTTIGSVVGDTETHTTSFNLKTLSVTGVLTSVYTHPTQNVLWSVLGRKQ